MSGFSDARPTSMSAPAGAGRSHLHAHAELHYTLFLLLAGFRLAAVLGRSSRAFAVDDAAAPVAWAELLAVVLRRGGAFTVLNVTAPFVLAELRRFALGVGRRNAAALVRSSAATFVLAGLLSTATIDRAKLLTRLVLGAAKPGSTVLIRRARSAEWHARLRCWRRRSRGSGLSAILCLAVATRRGHDQRQYDQTHPPHVGNLPRTLAARQDISRSPRAARLRGWHFDAMEPMARKASSEPLGAAARLDVRKER